MKNATLPLAIGVAVIGCILAIYANMNSSALKNVLDQERAKRFAAEQKLLQAQQKISSIEAQLGDSQSKLETIQKVITEGKATEKGLLSKLNDVKKERDALKKQVQAVSGTPAAEAAKAGTTGGQ